MEREECGIPRECEEDEDRLVGVYGCYEEGGEVVDRLHGMEVWTALCKRMRSIAMERNLTCCEVFDLLAHVPENLIHAFETSGLQLTERIMSETKRAVMSCMDKSVRAYH